MLCMSLWISCGCRSGISRFFGHHLFILVRDREGRRIMYNCRGNICGICNNVLEGELLKFGTRIEDSLGRCLSFVPVFPVPNK